MNFDENLGRWALVRPICWRISSCNRTTMSRTKTAVVQLKTRGHRGGFELLVVGDGRALAHPVAIGVTHFLIGPGQGGGGPARSWRLPLGFKASAPAG